MRKRSRNSRLMVIGLAGLILAASRASAAPPRSPVPAWSSRKVVSERIKGGWSASCSSDSWDTVCQSIILEEVTLKIPSAVTSATVVVTATFDHRITKGDAAVAGVSYGVAGDPFHGAEPGVWVVTDVAGDTSALTWTIAGLTGGQTYTFRLNVTPHHRGADDLAEIRGHAVAFVLDATGS